MAFPYNLFEDDRLNRLSPGNAFSRAPNLSLMTDDARRQEMVNQMANNYNNNYYTDYAGNPLDTDMFGRSMEDIATQRNNALFDLKERRGDIPTVEEINKISTAPKKPPTLMQQIERKSYQLGDIAGDYVKENPMSSLAMLTGAGSLGTYTATKLGPWIMKGLKAVVGGTAKNPQIILYGMGGAEIYLKNQADVDAYLAKLMGTEKDTSEYKAKGDKGLLVDEDYDKRQGRQGPLTEKGLFDVKPKEGKDKEDNTFSGVTPKQLSFWERINQPIEGGAGKGDTKLTRFLENVAMRMNPASVQQKLGGIAGLEKNRTELKKLYSTAQTKANEQRYKNYSAQQKRWSDGLPTIGNLERQYLKEAEGFFGNKKPGTKEKAQAAAKANIHLQIAHQLISNGIEPTRERIQPLIAQYIKALAEKKNK